MDDIVDRLWRGVQDLNNEYHQEMAEAAHEIKQLRAELDRKKYWLALVAKAADCLMLDAETGLEDMRHD